MSKNQVMDLKLLRSIEGKTEGIQLEIISLESKLEPKIWYKIRTEISIIVWPNKQNGHKKYQEQH
jgi:hypothetical protein